MGFFEYLGVRPRPEIFYYNTRPEFHPQVLAEKLEELILEELEKGKTGVVFLCIGTDRSTGDSLGPLIGHELLERERNEARNRNEAWIREGDGEPRKKRMQTAVFGTLDRPVHAMNLSQYQAFLKKTFPDSVMVAVDASVGSQEHVGYVTLGKGSLKPGLGVCKDLQEVGDIFITGIVGGCKSFDPVMLQSVRLSMVMRMADCICDSICLVENLWEVPAVV
ncbi:MAG: spore protease YyaC [Lachnospiraceae bacterium]|nr:spore protease YyaC [Lachnospiraceae bacterium]